MTTVLRLEDTVLASELRHRLALGLGWVDAVVRGPAAGSLTSIAHSVGPYRLDMVMERHRSDRFALRYAGLLRKRLDKAIADGLDTSLLVHVHAPAQAGHASFDATSGARLYVPRRLRFGMVLQQGTPVPAPVNIRAPWLWPGSAYPFPATCTLVRGRLRRGASLSSSTALRWGRVFATVPENEATFAQATIVGTGHGDDRGEYVLALDPRAVSGASLKNPVRVRLWAWVPPAGLPLDASDSFLGLPEENAGTVQSSAILRGQALPVAWTVSQSRIVDLQLGETLSSADTTFLFNP